MVYFALAICFVMALIVTPFVKKLAISIGAVDQPNERKVHQKLMPRLGDLEYLLVFCSVF
ncbi:UDP-N-acetylglucosamine--undecaprenyl-phosphateN-acetylglucosaminephosphotransferase [Lentibacillus sp. JNUCC-1]|nr:UDP-N-acetylglucosamine--undecaprenyl-phosphateN-acetylglucosaminephosphotransferase [Lentibacillus sp. JNUCC-1]